MGEAYDLILEEYLSKYLASNASITVYTITNSHTYEEFFSCRLDFGSLTYDGNAVSINSIDDSVANIIKANKGTQYEYSVDEIKDVYQLYYDSVSMNYSQPHTLGGNTVENDASLQYIVIDKGIYVEAITYSLPYIFLVVNFRHGIHLLSFMMHHKNRKMIQMYLLKPCPTLI